MSSFDVPRQSFAEMRAEIDAQNRAARELAQLLQLAIAQDLSKNQ
jgi:LPS-assembly lipoprotein